jgi:hypothetical protein
LSRVQRSLEVHQAFSEWFQASLARVDLIPNLHVCQEPKPANVQQSVKSVLEWCRLQRRRIHTFGAGLSIRVIRLFLILKSGATNATNSDATATSKS